MPRTDRSWWANTLAPLCSQGDTSEMSEPQLPEAVAPSPHLDSLSHFPCPSVLPEMTCKMNSCLWVGFQRNPNQDDRVAA